jgi:hypothetical protein
MGTLLGLRIFSDTASLNPRRRQANSRLMVALALCSARRVALYASIARDDRETARMSPSSASSAATRNLSVRLERFARVA